MLMSPLDGVDLPLDYPELAGRRVLVTGVSGSGGLGVEIVRMLAEQRACIIIGAADASPEVQAVAEMVAPLAPELHLISGPFKSNDDILRFARTAMQAAGGVDAVINVADVAEPPANASDAVVERLVTDILTMPCLVTKVAANRMRTALAEGTIINIVVCHPKASAHAKLVARIARTAIAAFTRTQAQQLAADGIKINAVAPADSERGLGCITGNADIVSLALHLASGRGSNLSGLMFEAVGG